MQPSDVAVIDFNGAPPSPEAQAKINAGAQFVMLRNGQTIDGHLFDIGGTSPLRITIDTPSGQTRHHVERDRAGLHGVVARRPPRQLPGPGWQRLARLARAARSWSQPTSSGPRRASTSARAGIFS